MINSIKFTNTMVSSSKMALQKQMKMVQSHIVQAVEAAPIKNKNNLPQITLHKFNEEKAAELKKFTLDKMM